VLTLVTTILSRRDKFNAFTLSVLLTKGVFKRYLNVRHLSVTRMTGNMESTGEYETAQKFTENLSLLSWGGVRVWW